MKIIKSLAKWLCPSSKKLARAAAEDIKTEFNGIEVSKREKIAKYSALARKIADHQAKLDEILADGRIDDAECERIAVALEPLIESARKIVFS